MTQLGLGLKNCAERFIIACIKSEKEELKSKASQWMEVYKHDYYTILGKPALEDVDKKRWNKPRLPLRFVCNVFEKFQIVKSRLIICIINTGPLIILFNKFPCAYNWLKIPVL